MEQGRPTEYKKAYDAQAKKLSELGITDAQMAEFFGVSVVTFNAWKSRHPSFLKSLKVSKEVADDQVERSLYNRAVGYDYPEDKIFNNNGEPLIVNTMKHVPPDPGAAKLWLTNRRGDTWREKQSHEHTGKDGGPIASEIQLVPLTTTD